MKRFITMQDIRIIAKIAISNEQKKRLDSLNVKYIATTNTDKIEKLVKRIGDATIILCGIYTPLSEEVLKKCKNLKFIQTWSTGIDHIDVEYAKSRNIKISNVTDYCTEAIAEKIIGILIVVLNALIEARDSTKKGKWEYQNFIGNEVKNKTMLIIGNGKIANRLKEIAKVFKMKIFMADSKTSKDKLIKYIKNSNFISINCSLNKQTYHMFSKKEFELMNGQILINTARGGIVDEKYMLKALNTGKLKYAILDVFQKEPPNKKILKHPKIFVTPHCMWNTEESLRILTDKCIDNIKLFIDGKLKNFL